MVGHQLSTTEALCLVASLRHFASASQAETGSEDYNKHEKYY